MSASETIAEQGTRILERARELGVLLRAMGAIGFRTHCPTYAYFQDEAGRVLSDLDFASYHEHRREVERLFEELDYVSDLRIEALSRGDRLIFENAKQNLHADVFFDKLDMCHRISFRGELEKDPLTIPLALLILEKMQIIRLTEKDVLDTSMALREHPVGNSDTETVNGAYISELCADDWGLWRTVTMNLQKVKERLSSYQFFTADDRQDISSKIEQLLKLIEEAPKSRRWNMRARIGDKVKWYTQIEEYIR